MLQGRLFSYGDAQRYRLGVNHWQIPVNQPKGVGIENICPFSRDGQMRVVDNNQGGGTHYYPNNHGKFDSKNLNIKSHHSQLMDTAMNIINVKMMIIILNNQVNCLDYNQRTLKKEFLQIQQMQWKA